MYSEKEAKQKWCPMMRSSATSSKISTNIEKDSTWNVNCKASECMMWRWAVAPMEVQEGYCGLAGMP